MKGIVIGIKGSRAIIMERGGSFREIKNCGYLMGQEIDIPKKRATFPFALAACLALFFFTGVGGYYFYNTPLSYMYVDINPSLRLEMNYFDKVISAVPLNEDAIALLEQCELDLSNGQRCVDSLIQASLELGYLNEENLDVEIDVHSKKGKMKDALVATENQFAQEGVSVTVFELDDTQNAFSLTNGVSASRLRALESYTEFFGGTLEENTTLLAETASQKIYAQIREHRRSTVASDQNAYTNPEISDKELEKDKIQTPSSEPTAEYLTKRQQAVESYTEYFGGSIEKNSRLLKSLTIGEIYEKIKTDRLAQQTNKQDVEDTETSQPEMPIPSTESDNTSPQSTGRRQQAIESYTEHFGGSIEENEERLKDFSIAQIYGAIRNDRSFQEGRRANN